MGDDLVSGSGGVGVVTLHHAVHVEDSLEQEWEQGDVVLFGEQGVGGVELVDVVGAVVGRKGDAGEDDPDSCGRAAGAAGFEGGDDLVEICAGVCDGEAAEAVVAAEFDDDYAGL